MNVTTKLAIAAALALVPFTPAFPTEGSDAAVNERPTYSTPTEYKCSKHFCIHWTNEGEHKVSQRDRNDNDVPDFAEVVLKAAEKSRKVYAAEGYRKPLGDASTPDHGPNGKVDIYLVDLGDAAGEAAPVTPYEQVSQSGHVRIDVADFAWNASWNYELAGKHFRYTDVQDLQAVVAHEMFHLVQFAYDGWIGSTWETESQASWAESMVYPKTGLARALGKVHMDGFDPFNNPDNPLMGDSKYAYSTFFNFVTQRYGRGSVQRILEAGSLEAWASQHGGMARVWTRYSLANLQAPAQYSFGKYLPVVATTKPVRDGEARQYALSVLGSKTFMWSKPNVVERVTVRALLPEAPADFPDLKMGKADWPVVATVLNGDGSVAKRQWGRAPLDGTPLNLRIRADKAQTVMVTVVNPDAAKVQVCSTATAGCSAGEEPKVQVSFGKSGS